MDKQTYEEAVRRYERLKHTNERGSIGLKYCEYTSSYDAYREDLDKLMEIVESQKPLEIVEGGVYIQLKEMYAVVVKSNTFRRIRLMYTECDTPIKLIVTKVTEESIYFEYENSRGVILYMLPLDQFNQHNFMKVEDN